MELDVVPLVGRTTSGGAFIEQLCVQEDFKQFIPACWLLSLRHPSTWVGQVLVRKPLQEGSPWCLLCPCPHSEPQLPPASAGDPPVLAGTLGPVSYEVTAFSRWIFVYLRSCVHPPRVGFLFPLVLWNSCDQTLMNFRTRFSGDSSSHCQTHRLGSLMWGSELSLLWENFSGIIIF